MSPVRLKLSDILKLCNATMESRNYIEGEQIFQGNHVVMCGTVPAEMTNKHFKIYGLVQQTSSLADVHEVQGNIGKDGGLSSRFVCSCKAGQSEECKHIMAVLLNCYSKDISQMEEISGTDKKCLWTIIKKEATAKYDVRPLETFCCYKKKRKAVDEYKSSLKLDTFNPKSAYEAFAALQESELGRHKLGVMSGATTEPEEREIEESDEFDVIRIVCEHANRGAFDFLKDYSPDPSRPCCDDFYRKYIVPSVSTFEIATRTALLKSEWTKERRYRVTGSRCRAVYTYRKSDWKTKADTLAMPKPFHSKFVAHGIKYESSARDHYSRVKDAIVAESGLIVVEKLPWLGYSPDGIVLDSSGVPIKLLEIKCPFKGKAQGMQAMLEVLTDNKKGGYLVKKDDKYILKKNHTYYSQIQLGLFLLNLNCCDFVIYNSFEKDMYVQTYNLDQKYVTEFTVKLKERYFTNLLHEFCSKSGM